MSRLPISAAFLGASLLAAPTFAAVTLLAPNSGITTVPADGSTFTGIQLLSTTATLSNPFNPAESANVTEFVYSSGGFLNFYYQFVNTGSGDAFNTLEVGKFTGYTTSVAYLTGNGGTIAPTNAAGANQASRTAVGDGVNFFYQATGSGGQFPAGSTSDFLEIDTNAVAVDRNGFAAAIDGGATQVGGLYEPLQSSGVPEPVAFPLLAVAALACLGRRGARVQSV